MHAIESADYDVCVRLSLGARKEHLLHYDGLKAPRHEGKQIVIEASSTISTLSKLPLSLLPLLISSTSCSQISLQIIFYFLMPQRYIRPTLELIEKVRLSFPK